MPSEPHRGAPTRRAASRSSHQAAQALPRSSRQRLLGKLNEAWAALKDSYAGLSAARLTAPGVTGDWSVKDILAHVTTWEGEALKHLPVIAAGGRPPRYAKHGGIDAFNARMTAEKRGLPLPDVLRQLDETHARLVDVVQRTPDAQLRRDTRFRRRLRLDTYGHYPEHAEAIRQWRERTDGPGERERATGRSH
jgi:Mycothiol maleylpyruvate isomerase N-terminal domain